MEKRAVNRKVAGSFRDPSGFVFVRGGLIYRQVNAVYRQNYDHLIHSGLYKILVDSGLLIPHEEVDLRHATSNEAYKVIKPEPVLFLSYPYEWCFSQLKHAALTLLQIQKKALDFNMTLKDCSAYNIQFLKCKPILIDTLSFEQYREGAPWSAYRQFCQHFLAPLALMSFRDVRLNQLLQNYLDGIPLDLTSRLLPLRTRFRFSLLSHIHLHAKSQKHFENKRVDTRRYKMGRLSSLGLIDSLESAIKKMKWRPQGTEWAEYDTEKGYSSDAFDQKKRLVANFLDEINPKIVWDLGANTGLFGRIASDKGIPTIAFDMDPAAVERNYLESIQRHDIHMLPLLLNLTNPSPGIGWKNEERTSFIQRGPANSILALALVHHLAISGNLPFSEIAEFFSELCTSLIIEFVPKNDAQAQRLLSTREDIFACYTQKLFENEFRKYFTVERTEKIGDSERILYLMRRK